MLVFCGLKHVEPLRLNCFGRRIIMKERYPRVEINLAHLRHNIRTVVEKCGAMGIDIAGVIKGATGLPEVAKAYDEEGAKWIASSRLE